MSKLEYDPEKAYDFVTGEDEAIPRCTCCYPPEPDCPVHKNDPRFHITVVTLLCFLIAPSKVAAVAYALLLGGGLIVVFVGLGVTGALGSVILRWWRR